MKKIMIASTIIACISMLGFSNLAVSEHSKEPHKFKVCPNISIKTTDNLDRDGIINGLNADYMIVLSYISLSFFNIHIKPVFLIRESSPLYTHIKNP